MGVTARTYIKKRYAAWRLEQLLRVSLYFSEMRKEFGEAKFNVISDIIVICDDEKATFIIEEFNTDGWKRCTLIWNEIKTCVFQLRRTNNYVTNSLLFVFELHSFS